MIVGRVFLRLILFDNSESFIKREPISNVSEWDPRRRKRGDSTTPADTISKGRCFFFLFFKRSRGLYSLPYGYETDDKMVGTLDLLSFLGLVLYTCFIRVSFFVLILPLFISVLSYNLPQVTHLFYLYF